MKVLSGGGEIDRSVWMFGQENESIGFIVCDEPDKDLISWEMVTQGRRLYSEMK